MSKIIRVSALEEVPCVIKVDPPPPPPSSGSSVSADGQLSSPVESEEQKKRKEEESRWRQELEERGRQAEELIEKKIKSAEDDARQIKEDAEKEIASAREAMMVECHAKKKEADEALAKAKSESRRMKDEAEREKKEMIDDANEQAVMIREEAEKKGHEEGLKAGREEGNAQIREEQKQIILDANAKAEKTLADAKEECRVYFEKAENDVASIAMEIVEKILPQHFIDVPQIILPLARKAIMKVKDQPEVNVRVAPDNYDLVLMARSEFQNLLEGNAILEVHSDDNLANGDVVVETPNGNVDARLSTQLDIIKKAIQDVMK